MKKCTDKMNFNLKMGGKERLLKSNFCSNLRTGTLQCGSKWASIAGRHHGKVGVGRGSGESK